MQRGIKTWFKHCALEAAPGWQENGKLASWAAGRLQASHQMWETCADQAGPAELEAFRFAIS